MSTAVVIGSGPNGLAAAVTLARAGVGVTVLEGADRPGGGARSSELTLPGVVHDDCSAFHPAALVSPFFTSLDLARHGLTWRWPEIDLAHPLDDGRAGVISRSMARTVESLGTDADRWRSLFGRWADRIDDLVTDIFRPILHVPKHPMTLAAFGVNALLPATWTARRWDDAPAKALFMGAAAHQFGRLDVPLTSSVGLLLAALGHARGWPVAAGGSSAIVAALIAVLEEHDGRVRTGVTVTSLSQIREVVGAAPDLVLFDTAPDAVLRIVGDELPGGIRRSFSRYRFGPAAHKVDLAIDGDVPWTNEACRVAGTLHLGGTAAEIVAAEADTAHGRLPERPFVLVGQQYLADPGRSAGSINPLWAYAHVPHGCRADATDAVIAQIERFAPGFRERIVAVHARTPHDLSTHNPNYVGGDISAGANTARQIVFRPRLSTDPYSLGLPGMYLCSSATPPGAGVHGMCGHNAARAALAHLARRRG